MNTNLISKEGNEAKFTIVFTADEFEDGIVKAYKKNKNKFTIDGFRKGKAPRKMIENFYGEDIFYDEALNSMLGSAYPAAINELDLEVINSPKLEVGEIKKGEEITITATVACFPEVEAKNYTGMEIERIQTEVTEDDVNLDLERIRKSQARMETVEDRKTEDGDTVIIDFDGSIDGEHFNGGKAENFELKLGSGQFIPGFEDQLIGKETGDEVEVVATFPEDYNAKDLAGKEAHFQTKIHEIKKEILPELDDELAEDVSEFDTLAELKKDVEKNMKEDAAKRDEAAMKDQVLEKLYEGNEIEVPAVMIENEIDGMLQDMNQQLSYQGLNMDKYMEYGFKEDAKKRVSMRILLKAVIRQENISADEEEIENELKKFADQYGQTVEQVKKVLGDNYKYFEEDVKTRKAIDFMFDKAKLVEKKEEAEEDK